MRVAAVDMGATSVRVTVVDLDVDRPEVVVVHRWFHGPEPRPDGSVRWRWSELLDNVRVGLERARESGPLASIGIDGWAVDYGLLGDDGRLLSDPHSYRSPRTRRLAGGRPLRSARRTCTGGPGSSSCRSTRSSSSPRTMPTNSPGRAGCVMLPELVAYELTGEVVSERSNAGTTGLLDVTTGEWAADLVEAIGVDPRILPRPEAGRPQARRVSTARRSTSSRHTTPHVRSRRARWTPTAAHSSPPGPGSSSASSARPPTPPSVARLANFSNEIGAVGGYRYLKNVTGFWLLEQCGALWGETARELLDLAAEAPGAPVFDVRDERFLAPARMDDEVRAAAGLGVDAPHSLVARSIVESVAAGVAAVVEELRLTQRVEELAVVGGAAASRLVRERLAEHTGLPVVAGATEATALGNSLLQGIALGRFADLTEGRRWARGDQSA